MRSRRVLPLKHCSTKLALPQQSTSMPPWPLLAGRRRVEAVNISPFIANLPFGKDTANFATPDASGSTSQVPAVEGRNRLWGQDAAGCGSCAGIPIHTLLLAARIAHGLPPCLLPLARSAAVLSLPISAPPCPALPCPFIWSQKAANIQEALEVGSQTLLVDEDTSATNCEPTLRTARLCLRCAT